MRFYRGVHRNYCGIDLHARTMYLCLIDHAGTILLHRSIHCTPEEFLAAVEPYRDDPVVAVECIFCWYWLVISATSTASPTLEPCSIRKPVGDDQAVTDFRHGSSSPVNTSIQGDSARQGASVSTS